MNFDWPKSNIFFRSQQWNKLPKDIKDCRTIKNFKHKFKKHFFEKLLKYYDRHFGISKKTIFVSMSAFMCMRMLIFTSLCMDVFSHVYMYVYVCVYIYTHVYTGADPGKKNKYAQLIKIILMLLRRRHSNTSKACMLPLGVWGRCKPPSGGPGATPPKTIKFVVF